MERLPGETGRQTTQVPPEAILDVHRLEPQRSG